MSKEAMKLALEAMENMVKIRDCQREKGYPQSDADKRMQAAITALREALAKPDFWEGYVPEPVKPAQQEPVVLEPAPDNSLPKWNECALRVSNSELIAKRVTEGGYGPDHNAKLASALHRFIYEYDDADPYRSGWFLHRLEQVISECTSPPAQRTWVGLSDEEKAELDAEYGDDTLAHLDAIEAKLKEKNT